MLHMSRREIMTTRYGEMCDLLACYAIHNGAKPKKRLMTYLEAMEVD